MSYSKFLIIENRNCANKIIKKIKKKLKLEKYKFIKNLSAYARSKRSKFITLFQAAIKSCRNFS